MYAYCMYFVRPASKFIPEERKEKKTTLSVVLSFGLVSFGFIWFGLVSFSQVDLLLAILPRRSGRAEERIQQTDGYFRHHCLRRTDQQRQVLKE